MIGAFCSRIVHVRTLQVSVNAFGGNFERMHASRILFTCVGIEGESSQGGNSLGTHSRMRVGE